MIQNTKTVLTRIFGKQQWRALLRAGGFTAVAAGFVMLLVWDALWSLSTTFRGMSFAETYVNALLLAMLLALPAVFRLGRWIQLAVWLIVAFVLEANLMYCRTYLSWIPLASYALAGNLSDFISSVTDSLRWLDILLVIPPLAAMPLLRRGARESSGKTPKDLYFCCMAALALLAVTLPLARGGFREHVSKLKESCYYATTPPVVYTLPATLMATTGFHEAEASPETIERVKAWLAENRDNAEGYPVQARSYRRNLVVIFCESLESWVIGAKADGSKTLTPYLNSLATDSATLFVPHVTSQAGTGRSIDAQLLMLAGLMPYTDGVWSMSYPDRAYPSLAKAMLKRDPDLKTMLFTQDRLLTWNQGRVAASFGIRELQAKDAWDFSETVGEYGRLSDGSLFRQTVGKLKGGDWLEGEPAYLQVLTFSGHNPFYLEPEKRLIHISDAYPERLRDYMTMANYTDAVLHVLIDYLRSRSDWEETMVVIVGDHEALGADRPGWRGDRKVAEMLPLEQEVPLLVLNSPVAGRIDKTIGQVDVYSTLTDLMGLRPYAWTGLGRSVMDPFYEGLTAETDRLREAAAVSEDIIKYNLFGLIPESK